jgi:hypothetical protein
MIPEEAIRLRSYLIWQKAGYPQGKALEHWLRAKQELDAESRPALQLCHDCESKVVARPPILRPPQQLPSSRVSASEERRVPITAARR